MRALSRWSWTARRARALKLKTCAETAQTVADARLGEKVCIAVVTRPQMRLDADELLQHLAASGLSKYDMPEYFVALDRLPLTASGKILKRTLVEQVAAGALRPLPVRSQT